jgi:hypothetical protein
VLFSYDWSSVAKAYPLWVAQYPNYEDTGFTSEPWTDGWDFGAWDSPLIFQYTGTGSIPGYGGHLDLDLFYGTHDDWRRLCAVAGASAGTGGGHREHLKSERGRADHGAPLLLPAEHGYSQPGRHGTSGHCRREYRRWHDQGDQGRPRLLIRCVRGLGALLGGLSLRRADHALQLDRRHARDVRGLGALLLGTHVFNASRGDIYLDEENHTAMCIRNDGTADLLGEFSISETGGIDGEPGDQTGRESWVHDYYSGSWDGILHYNGKADVGGAPGGSGSGAPSGDVSELAERVIAGEFGNGDARRAALGSRYDEVQAEVNRILLGGGSGIDVDAMARRVIAGEFGNGDERKRRLGSNYDAVQRRVNEILLGAGSSSTSMDIDAMARAVIRGDYGNGEERRRRLGSYYSIVQSRVNEMLS